MKKIFIPASRLRVGTALVLTLALTPLLSLWNVSQAKPPRNAPAYGYRRKQDDKRNDKRHDSRKDRRDNDRYDRDRNNRDRYNRRDNDRNRYDRRDRDRRTPFTRYRRTNTNRSIFRPYSGR